MEAGEEAEILQSGEFQVVVRRFERDTDPAVVTSVPRPEVSAECTDVALIAVEESDQHVLGRALAGAAWAKESKDFVRFDREGQIANRGPVGAWIREAEGLNVEDGHLAETLTWGHTTAASAGAHIRRTSISSWSWRALTHGE